MASSQAAIVAVVDPISTGANLLAEVASRGFTGVAVWSRQLHGCTADCAFEVNERATLLETVDVLTTARCYCCTHNGIQK